MTRKCSDEATKPGRLTNTDDKQIGDQKTKEVKDTTCQGKKQSDEKSTKGKRNSLSQDEEIQLIHEKFNDRITITRESEKNITDNHRLLER